MGRLIDADDVLDNLYQTKLYKLSNKFEELIRRAPTVDAVRVVRCAECYHLGIRGLCDGYCKMNMSRVVKPEDYCSDGERKEKDDAGNNG